MQYDIRAKDLVHSNRLIYAALMMYTLLNTSWRVISYPIDAKGRRIRLFIQK